MVRRRDRKEDGNGKGGGGEGGEGGLGEIEEGGGKLPGVGGGGSIRGSQSLEGWMGSRRRRRKVDILGRRMPFVMVYRVILPRSTSVGMRSVNERNETNRNIRCGGEENRGEFGWSWS